MSVAAARKRRLGVAEGFVPHGDWALVEMVPQAESTEGGLAVASQVAKEHQAYIGWLMAAGAEAWANFRQEEEIVEVDDKVAFLLFSGNPLIVDPLKPDEGIRVVRAMDIMGHWRDKKRGTEPEPELLTSRPAAEEEEAPAEERAPAAATPGSES